MALRWRELWDDLRHGRRTGADALAAEIDTVRRVRAQYRSGTRLNFGAPTRCPRCADFGLIEHVDVATGRAENRCLRCGTEWTISARALLAVEREDASSDAAVAARAAAGAEAALARLRRRQRLEADLTGTGEVDGVRFRRTSTGRVLREPVTLGSGGEGRPDATRPAARPTAPPVPMPAAARMVPLRVLLVEDDPDDVALVRTLLEPAGPGIIDLRTADTRAAGEAVARANIPDLVLLDLGLPDSRGVATLTSWRDHVRGAPVLVVSGDAGPEVLDRGRDLGVVGVLDKAQLADMLARGDEGTADFVELLGAGSLGRG